MLKFIHHTNIISSARDNWILNSSWHAYGCLPTWTWELLQLCAVLSVLSLSSNQQVEGDFRVIYLVSANEGVKVKGMKGWLQLDLKRKRKAVLKSLETTLNKLKGISLWALWNDSIRRNWAKRLSTRSTWRTDSTNSIAALSNFLGRMWCDAASAGMSSTARVIYKRV